MSVRKQKTPSSPVLYESTFLDGEDFFYTADVHVSGDIDLSGKLVVGGNLTVDGSLNAADIYCLGSVRVGGDIHAGNLFVGFCASAGRRIDVGYIKTGCLVEEIAGHAEIDTEKINWINDIVHPRIAEMQADERENNCVELAVSAGTDIDCFCIDTHPGDVEVGGLIDFDIAQIEGYLTAQEIVAQEDLRVYGGIDCRGNFWGDEVWTASDIHCAGNFSAGDVTLDDGDLLVLGHLTAYSIDAPGNIQAGEWIAVSATLRAGRYIKAGASIVGERGIESGKDYGIFAGLCVPRSEWNNCGFVSASPRPKNILSGKYVLGVTLDDLLAAQKAADQS
jgi:cytoskeletal protein CcmA (bactofilin family)